MEKDALLLDASRENLLELLSAHEDPQVRDDVANGYTWEDCPSDHTMAQFEKLWQAKVSEAYKFEPSKALKKSWKDDVKQSNILFEKSVVAQESNGSPPDPTQ